MPAPILQTPRLVLRELVADDAPFILALLHDPAWLRYIGNRNVADLEGARAYIERTRAMYARHGYGLWLVERREDGEALGLCGLIKRDKLEDVDVGFGFFERHHGQGYAYESAQAVMQAARSRFGLGRVVAITTADNVASSSLLEKLGLRFERTLAWEPGGDMMLYATPG